MKTSALCTSCLFALVAVAAVSVTTVVPSRSSAADQPPTDAVGRTPPRLSFFEGEVSFWRPGAEDWTEAQINLPLAPGDQLYTGTSSNLELQIGPRAYVRAAADSQLGVENQEPDFLQMRVASGDVSIDICALAPGHTVEIDTPHAAFTIERTGYYRARVNEVETTFIVRRGGGAEMTVESSAASRIRSGEQSVIRGSENPSIETFAAPDLDDWDGWNYGRTDRILASGRSPHVAEDVYAAEELEDHGTWRQEPSYGPVWVPRRVASDWAPYTDGRWIWDPYYGWTWLSSFSWGWAPFHYGRWVYLNDGWGWAPGPRIVAPAYAPALVGFFGGGVGVSVGISVPVGWVSLSWGEPLYPWWGSAGFCQRPWWGGWGGSRVVINKTKIVNKTKIIHVDGYRNGRHKNGLVVVRGDRFGRGHVRSGRIDKYDRDRMRPVRGNPQPRPAADSLQARNERGRRPPNKLLQRSVVGTRPAQDPSSRLRAAGLKSASTRQPPVRLVESSRQRRVAANSVPAIQPQRRHTDGQASTRRDTRTERAAAPRSGVERGAQQAPDPRQRNLRRAQPSQAGVAPSQPRARSESQARRDTLRPAPSERQPLSDVPRARGRERSEQTAVGPRNDRAPQRDARRSRPPGGDPRVAPRGSQPLGRSPLVRRPRAPRAERPGRTAIRRQQGAQPSVRSRPPVQRSTRQGGGDSRGGSRRGSSGSRHGEG